MNHTTELITIVVADILVFLTIWLELNSLKNRVENLEAELSKKDDNFKELVKHAEKIIDLAIQHDKQYFVYEVRREEQELINDGKKFRSIKKIIK